MSNLIFIAIQLTQIRMRNLLILSISIFVLITTGPARAQGSDIIPAKWLPPLAPSIESTIEQFKEATGQSEMNSLSRHIADMRDAQLFILYVRLYERLAQKERAKLRQEQTAWLKARAKAARDAVESQGGSLAPLEANNAEVTLTEKRIVELRARLKIAEKN